MRTNYQKNVVRVKHFSVRLGNYNPDMNTIGDRIKKTREARGFSQGQLAKLVGYKGQSSIGNIESGLQAGSTKIAQLAEALNVSATWLETGIGDPDRGTPTAREMAAKYENEQTELEKRLLSAFKMLTSSQKDDLLKDAEKLARYNKNVLSELSEKE